jgi:hypothetical protein
MLLQLTARVSGWAGGPANETDKCFRLNRLQKAERTAQSAARCVSPWCCELAFGRLLLPNVRRQLVVGLPIPGAVTPGRQVH